MARDGERGVPQISTPEGDKVVPDLSELLLGPEEPTLDVLAWGPATIPLSVAYYALGGEQGLTTLESVIRRRAGGLNAGKISKYDALYAPQTPIPFGFWEYKCSTCRFYNDPQESGTNAPRCDVVGQDGDPFAGQAIHPQGWCALWLPVQNRDWFEFATERLESSPEP